MADEKKISLTIEEGQAMLHIAANFGLPESLGPDQRYTNTDRAIAADEVRKLYREIRSRSPLLQRIERWQRFGPSDAWAEVKSEGGKIGHRCTDPGRLVPLSIDEEITSGMVWCLLVALHPVSAGVASVSMQEDIFWPIAAKLKKTRIIRETIGMTSEKSRPVRWRSDDELEASEAKDSKEEK